MHKTLTMLEEKLCKDIEESMREEKITPATMEMLDKAVDIIKDISTIEAMEEYGDDYSEMSYARRRDSRGRYSNNSYGDHYNGSYDDDIHRRMDNMSQRDKERLEDFMRRM